MMSPSLPLLGPTTRRLASAETRLRIHRWSARLPPPPSIPDDPFAIATCGRHLREHTCTHRTPSETAMSRTSPSKRDDLLAAL